jgi:hypothetical protein
MTVSETSIANSALIKIGEAPIASLDDPSKAGRTCKRQYPLMRDQLLEDFNWKFAIARATLAPDATAPEFGYLFKFLLPSDSLRFLGLYSESAQPTSYTGTRIPHQIEGRELLLNVDTAEIFYIKRETNPTLFSSSFVEVLALVLAIDICYAMTGGTAHEARLIKRFDAQVKRAHLTQAIQGQPEVIESSEWLDAHDYGSGDPGRRGFLGPC